MKYIFSYCKKVKVPVLVRRPWWNLVGRDTIKMREQLHRHVIADIPETEAKLLIGDSATMRLICKVLGEIQMVQLESTPEAGDYIATSGGAERHRVAQRLEER